jgi:acetoin utilization deacetylase AcuC-like enzyme
MGKGKHYAFNVPLMDGVTDEQYTEAFDRYKIVLVTLLE